MSKNKINLNIFEYLELIGGLFCNSLTYVLLFILNPGHTFDEVKKGRMLLPQKFNKESPPKQVDIASKYYQEEVQRSNVVDEKNKVLLTIASLLMAACSVIASSVEPKWLALIPLVFTVISIFLVLVYFGVQSVKIPQYELTVEDDLSKSYHKCKESLARATEFRVGIYRAASRAVILGILSLLMTFIFFVSNESSSSEVKFIKALHNDTELQNILRGPQGPIGPKGETGSKGEMGPQGPMGPRGDSKS